MTSGREVPAGPDRGGRIAALLEGAWRVSPPTPLKLSPADLAEITPLLLSTGGAALAWWRVRHSDLRSSPAAVALQHAYRLHTLEDAVRERQISQLVAAIRSSGVEPLLAKGWAAARLYPEPGLRPYGDVDLYVPPDRHATALAALSRLDPPPGPVDLHRGLAELDDRTADEVLARSVRVRVGGVEVRILGPEDHLRLLCLHMLRHGVWRPLWLCDVGAALESRPATFDWDCFLAGSRRRRDYLLCALGLAHNLLGARLEGTPVADRDTLPQWLVPAVLRQWGKGSGWREPLGTYLRRPAGILAEVRRHWPNPVEGTVGVGAPFNELPRFPFQIAHAAIRTTRFALGLPRLLRPSHGRAPGSGARGPGAPGR